MLWIFGTFYDHLVHFLFIWYIFLVLASCAKKHLATLMRPWKSEAIKKMLPTTMTSATITPTRYQGCQMVYFLTKNCNLGTFWRALQLKMLV
jgi:hypothetical protein